jgi:hypothetical protein
MSDTVRIGDRVKVPPRTALLGRPAPGGPGTVLLVEGDPAYAEVLLDTGERRHPFVRDLEVIR